MNNIKINVFELDEKEVQLILIYESYEYKSIQFIVTQKSLCLY